MLLYLKMFGYILVFIVTLIVAYILGLTLVNVVDNRLSNISINVPKQNVTLNVESFADYNSNSKNNSSNTENKIIPHDKPESFADIQQEVKDIKTPPISGVDQNRDFNLRPDLFNQTSRQENVCIFNHKHQNCRYGVTNYPEPCDMSPTDRKAFALSYPKNLTLQDYINWLWTNKRNTNLSKEHMTNLTKIKRRIPLKYEAGVIPPLSNPQDSKTVSEHFANLYKDGFGFKYPVTTRLYTDDPNVEAFSASNYEDCETQSDANNLGSAFDPPKNPKKFNAKTLFRMTTPQIKPEKYIHISPANPLEEFS